MRQSILPSLVACTTLLSGVPAVGQGACGLFEAVEPGDTFTTVAARCGVDLETLSAANPGIDGSAPEVASVLSLLVAEPEPVAGQPVSPGPRTVAVTPHPPPAPEATLVIIGNDDAPAAARQSYLADMLGLWSQSEGVCADPEMQWRLEPDAITVSGTLCAIGGFGGDAEAVSVETACAGDGTLVGREFRFATLDGQTLEFVVGDESDLLTWCAPA